MEKSITIGALAKLSGTNVVAIQHYENRKGQIEHCPILQTLQHGKIKPAKYKGA